MAGTKVVTSAVLPGHNSQQIGLACTSRAKPTTNLAQVGPMVLVETPFAQLLAALAFKVQAGGVEKDQLHFGKQVAPAVKEPLFEQVFGAAHRAVCGLPFGRQRLAQKGHRPVEVMQPEPFGARQQVSLAPPFGGAVTAAGKQAVEHRQVDGPFEVKLEAAPLEQGAQRLRDAAFLPQAAEDQVRADAAHGHRLGLTGRVGVQHGQARALAHPRAHQPIQLAALLQPIQPAQGGS